MSNRLEERLQRTNSDLYSKLQNTASEVELLLQEYSKNFQEYTDHSIKHTRQVFDYASQLLSDEQIKNLNDDEVYVLSMACYLHDVGMCIPEDKIKDIEDTEEILEYRKNYPDKPVQDFIRDIHHVLSYKFIVNEMELLGIPNKKYAEAIGLVAQGHRKVDLSNVDIYKPKFIVKSGRDFVCLPYLSAIIRIADELDITNIRTPRLLTKYYMPNNEFSQREWKKHIATTIVSVLPDDDTIRYEVVCTTQDIYAALQEQFQKIDDTILYGQKIIKNISNTGKREFCLDYTKLDVEYKFEGFDPKGIKFSFDVKNVVNTLIGEDLYSNKMAAFREVIQNAIDTCRYKKVIQGEKYKPEIKIDIFDNKISIYDNGLGMDDFIIENYFGKLASSYYQQESVAKKYDAIGQFGIGVFSYFLVAEYIDIETKSNKSEALKFRIDKDPNNYFHFFDKTHVTQNGSKITLYYKKDFEVDKDTIKNFIENTFRYIEFPIVINSNKTSFLLEKQPYQIDAINDLKAALYFRYKDKFDEFEYISYNYNEDDYEGVAIFYYLKDLNNHDEYLGRYFDNEILFKNSRHTSSSYEISQKGVFVNNLSNHFAIPNSKGIINLKTKAKINLNRQGFSETKFLDSIIKKVNKALLTKFFDSQIPLLKKNKLPRFCFNYLNNNLTLGVSHYAYFKVLYNSEFLVLNKEEILELDYEELIVTDLKKIKQNYEHQIYIDPILKLKNKNSDEIFYYFKSIFGGSHNIELDLNNEKLMILFKKKNKENKSLILNKAENYIEILKSKYHNHYEKFKNSTCLIYNFGDFFSVLNLNHNFIKKLSKLEYQALPEVDKILDEMFLLIQIISRRETKKKHTDNKESIGLLNDMSNLLAKEIGLNYTFSENDFKRS